MEKVLTGDAERQSDERISETDAEVHAEVGVGEWRSAGLETRPGLRFDGDGGKWSRIHECEAKACAGGTGESGGVWRRYVERLRRREAVEAEWNAFREKSEQRKGSKFHSGGTTQSRSERARSGGGMSWKKTWRR